MKLKGLSAGSTCHSFQTCSAISLDQATKRLVKILNGLVTYHEVYFKGAHNLKY